MSAHQRGGHATRWLLWFVCIYPATVAVKPDTVWTAGCQLNHQLFHFLWWGGCRVPRGLLPPLRSKLDCHPLSCFTVGRLFSKMNEVSICRRGDDDLKMTFRLPYTKRDR